MLTPDEYAVFPYLAERFGEVFADLSELALLGVMRQADVRLLQRPQVYLTERLLLLPRTKGGPRAVRLSPEAVTILTRAMARHPEHEYVFANPRTGQPYSRVHISRCWRIAARECGLRDFTCHDLRYHGPTIAANRGASTAILQAMGGWKSARMVERYTSILNPTLDQYLTQIGRSPRPPLIEPYMAPSRPRKSATKVGTQPQEVRLLTTHRFDPLRQPVLARLDTGGT